MSRLSSFFRFAILSKLYTLFSDKYNALIFAFPTSLKSILPHEIDNETSLFEFIYSNNVLSNAKLLTHM